MKIVLNGVHSSLKVGDCFENLISEKPMVISFSLLNIKSIFIENYHILLSKCFPGGGVENPYFLVYLSIPLKLFNQKQIKI